jgi:hypothetical protein
MASIDLNGFASLRREMAALAVGQGAADAAIADALAARDEALRRGAGAGANAALEERLAVARANRARVVADNRVLQQRLDRLAEGVLGQRDPALALGAFAGNQPIALLPMRLETRYVTPADRPTELRIRIYPDDLNTIDHEAAPTAVEADATMAYWRARFAHDDAEAERLLRDLTLRSGRGRASWLVRALTPTNPVPPAGAADAPGFPAVETIDPLAKKTRAVLLPERWCAIGYAAGRREVFRVWGNTIPEELVLTPDWLATDDPEALLAGERAWMVDYDAALANGMAITVTQAAVETMPGIIRGGFQLATGTIERLLVVGFEWTRNAADSVAAFTELLGAHRDSSGLGFAAPGTPTNNTEAAPSGYSPSEQKTPPAPPSGAPPEDQDALELLSWAFGIASGALPADNIDNPHLSHQRTGLHMMNALWRGTFGDYLMTKWNPLVEGQELLGTAEWYALRRYASTYVRPTGALPIVRVDNQPYGTLPVVGKSFVDPQDSAVETALGKVLGVLRPMWELASERVPLMTDGDVDKAKDILQTAAWSQTAYYRDKDAKAVCFEPSPFSQAQISSRTQVIDKVLGAVGGTDEWNIELASCNDFLPDPPYSAGYLGGVPWVMADPSDAAREAADETALARETTVAPPADNYLAALAAAAAGTLADGTYLDRSQAGPSLLQALLAYSVQKEQGDAVDRSAGFGPGINRVSRAISPMPYVAAAPENEAMFAIQTPKEFASVVIPSVTGKATLGEYVASTLAAQLQPPKPSVASRAARELFEGVSDVFGQMRDLAAVQHSLEFLATRAVGELNIALRSTLDAFSYRLDAWIVARAIRRLEQMRLAQPTGLYVGGYAWVENLKADARPASEGYLLAPSQAQAATAAILRSGFMANHDQGAFDIDLDSKRTRRALDILQGLTRDQPLAALYGYRLERGLRDASLGKFIWPLRLAYPWRPASDQPSTEPAEAVGARDVVDGVALLGDAEQGLTAVVAKLNAVLGQLQPAQSVSAPDQDTFARVVADAADLADSVSDLLLAEGTHQIVKGNPVRAAAAMATADKQALPVEAQVGSTPRGGASYTQRIVAVCPGPSDQHWPSDRRARAEPGLDAWLASMLGDPGRYRFQATPMRLDADGVEVPDDEGQVGISAADLGLSPLSVVLLAEGVTSQRLDRTTETRLRSSIASALMAQIKDPAGVVALQIDAGIRADAPGFSAFEAIAITLKALVDKSRFATRKDMVHVDDTLEGNTKMTEYAGVDVGEITSRADALVTEFDNASAALLASADADSLLSALSGLSDMLPPVAWPAQVFAIDAPNADPVKRDARAAAAIDALAPLLKAMHDDLHAAPPLLPNQVAPSDAQLAQHAMDQLRRLFGRDFPVLPRFSLGPYATEFNASLADQSALASGDVWRINGWLTQVARVRPGADAFAAALSAHEAVCAPLARGDLKVVQFPYLGGREWAALPEAWQHPEGTAFDPKQVPEELRDFLAAQPAPPYRDINAVAPNLAIVLHAPGIDQLDAEATCAALVCDDWPEFIPDPFQTAAIAFHYDAPGARPPQTILLALPPVLHQESWRFEDALDVVHEAFDLAKLRGVRPRDLAGGLGAILPGNFLPHGITDVLPSVKLLEMQREAHQRMLSSLASSGTSFVLGKI